jgi:peroxiredoxin
MSASPDTKHASLTDMIAEFQADLLPTLPAEVMQTMQQAGQKIAALGIEQSALKTGDRCPEFSLTNARGEHISSRRLLAKSDLVISFYRGAWCPYCNLEIKALSQNLAEIRAIGAELVAISPQVPEKSEQQSDSLKLDFEVLSDTGNQLAKQFGLVFTLPQAVRPLYQAWEIDIPAHNGDDQFQLPVPATYIIDQAGFIRYHFVDSDYTKRLEPSVIMDQLRSFISHA